MVFAQSLLGADADEAKALEKQWNDAMDNAALARMRYRQGTEVRIVSGAYSGTCGTIDQLC